MGPRLGSSCAKAADGLVARVELVDGDDSIDPRRSLELPERPAREAPTTAKVNVSLQILDAVDRTVSANQVDGGSSLAIVVGTGLSGAQVHECANPADPACTDPGNEAASTDDAGIATFSLSDNFNGFFQVSRSDLVPYLFFPGNLPVGVTDTTLSIGALTQRGMQGVVDLLPFTNVTPSFPPDGGGATEGMVFFEVYDCHDVYAPDVAVSLVAVGRDTLEYYTTANNVVSLTAVYTSVTGAGGFFNVPVGGATVKAQIAAGPLAGTVLGSVTVPVVAGSVAQVWFRERTR